MGDQRFWLLWADAGMTPLLLQGQSIAPIYTARKSRDREKDKREETREATTALLSCNSIIQTSVSILRDRKADQPYPGL